MLHKIALFVPSILSILLVAIAWKFGDWKNWKKYYPTIVFAIAVDFFISIVLYKHSLWYFHKATFVPNHTIADFLIAFTNLPAIVLLYLPWYPYKSRLLRQIAYICCWVILFTIIESLFLFFKLLSYHNGWNFLWTSIVWIFIFVGLLIHYKKPLLAWLICFVCTIILIIYFQIPVTKMK